MNTIVLETTDVSFEDFIKNGTIMFHSNVLPASSFATSAEEPSSVISRSQGSDNSVSSFLKDIWNSAKYFGGNVESIVTTLIADTIDLADGDADISNNFPAINFGWNTNKKSIPIGHGVECSQCFISLGVSLQLLLNVKDYSVTSLQVMANLGIEAQAKIKIPSKISDSMEVSVGTVQSAPIPFTVGPVPVVIQFQLPVSLGYNAAISASVDSFIMGNIKASTAFGVKYADGALTPVHSTSDVSYSGAKDLQAVSAQATGYLSAPFTVNIDFMGGIYLGMKPFVSVAATEGSARCAITSALNTGFQLSLGAKINLKSVEKAIWSGNIPAQTLYNMQVPIFSECIKASSAMEEDDDSMAFAGATWYGYQTSSDSSGCEDYPEADISYQLISNDNNAVYFFGAINGWLDEEAGGCMLQTLFRAEINGNTMNLIPSGSSDDTFSICEDLTTQLEPVSAKGTISNDWSQISLITDDNCLHVELKRA